MPGWRKALFLVLWAAGRALDLSGRAAMHLAVGTLLLRDLREAIANTWEEFGRAESAILSGLMPWERALYDRFLEPGDRILVVGCGTGRDLVALLKLGYRVEGLDVGPRAIALARQMLEKEGLEADLHTGPIEAIALPGRFDAFIFSWFCYGYIPQAATRIGVLVKVSAHLNPGGRILISYLPVEPPPRALPIQVTRLAARLTRSDWTPELGDAVSSAGPDPRRIHYEHRFSRDEVEHEARAAGLTVIAHENADQGTAVLIV